MHSIPFRKYFFISLFDLMSLHISTSHHISYSSNVFQNLQALYKRLTCPNFFVMIQYTRHQKIYKNRNSYIPYLDLDFKVWPVFFRKQHYHCIDLLILRENANRINTLIKLRNKSSIGRLFTDLTNTSTDFIYSQIKKTIFIIQSWFLSP